MQRSRQTHHVATLILGVALLATQLMHSALADPIPYSRLSQNTAGAPGNSASYLYRSVNHISADGRFVVFNSNASNLHADDTDNIPDIYAYDRNTDALELISTSGGTSPTKGNNESYDPTISADGHFVAFHSEASNLDPNDSDSIADIFVYDRNTDTLELISTSGGTSPTKGNNSSFTPSLSADGRFVAFSSNASNLHPDDTDNIADIFVHDRDTNTLELISTSGGTSPTKGNDHSSGPSLSADGRFVAFSSTASNLDPDDTDNIADILVYDRDTKTLELISTSGGTSPTKGNDNSFTPSLSNDGRFVAFISRASNLHPDDTDGFVDIFVYDRDTDALELISTSGGTSPTKGNNSSYTPSLSDDGRFVAFSSTASNLHPDDTDSTSDIFVYDRDTDALHLISQPSGVAGEGSSGSASISPDGDLILFSSADQVYLATQTPPAR